MSTEKVTKVVIVGGGTAGWMAAAALARLIGRNIHVSLIESEEIGTVGVGEATIPTMMTLHHLLKINEREFLSAVQGTFKLGISFENWKNLNQDYIHSFGLTGQDCWAGGFQHFWLKGRQRGISEDFGHYSTELMAAKANKFAVLPNNGLSYAYHMDASLYAKFLRKLAEAAGVQRIEGKIVKVDINANSGDIDKLTLESGQVVEGELFVDCSGFRGLLINETLQTPSMTGRSGSPVTARSQCRLHQLAHLFPIPDLLLERQVGSGVFPCNHEWGTGLFLVASISTMNKPPMYC